MEKTATVNFVEFLENVKDGANKFEEKILTETRYQFLDIKHNKWYFKGVDYVYKKGYMNGVTENAFQPNGKVGRGMVAVVLWNMEGNPKSGNANPFFDIDDWYKDGIKWASARGIVSGKGNNLYKPEENLTREEMMVVLYNYCQRYEKATRLEEVAGAKEAFKKLADYDEISPWALEAMEWAYCHEVISGTNGKLNPKGEGTRGELATIICNCRL